MKNLRYILAIFGLGRGFEMTLRNSELGKEFEKFRDGLFLSLVFVPVFIYGLSVEAFDILWTFIIGAIAIFGVVTAVMSARSSYKGFGATYDSHDWSTSMGWLKSKQFMFKRRFRGVGSKGSRSWSPRFGLLDPELSAIVRMDPNWSNKRNAAEMDAALGRKADLWRHYRNNSSLFKWFSDKLVMWYRWHVLFYGVALAMIIVAGSWNWVNVAVGLALILGGIWYEIYLAGRINMAREMHKKSEAMAADPMAKARENLAMDATMSFSRILP